jgi:hypothetical protein
VSSSSSLKFIVSFSVSTKKIFKKNLRAFPSLWQAPHIIFAGDIPPPSYYQEFNFPPEENQGDSCVLWR